MVIRFYPSRKQEKSSALERFLTSEHVEYEMVLPSERRLEGTRLYGPPEEPVVEIDGRIFVNPNPQALRKYLTADTGIES